jgi:hypothetical protein
LYKIYMKIVWDSHNVWDFYEVCITLFLKFVQTKNIY